MSENLTAARPTPEPDEGKTDRSIASIELHVENEKYEATLAIRTCDGTLGHAPNACEIRTGEMHVELPPSPH